MPAITKNTKVREGQVVGTVSTDKVGSDSEFYICLVEDWIKLTDEEAEMVAKEALWGSGQIDWWY